MAKRLAKGAEHQVKANKFGLALSWDQAGKAVDLDLQAVAFSDTGKLLDAVYYNNLKALHGLTHSGDETSGAKKGFDECIWVHLQKLLGEVHLIVFVVACYKGGNIRDAKNAKVHMLEDVLSEEVGVFSLEQVSTKATVVASLRRKSSSGWVLTTLDLPSKKGQHFIDILEPTIGDYVRSILPRAPRKIKAAFAMEKGSVVDLPESNAMVQTIAGLGWDTSGGEVDLDVSAVLLDAGNNEVDCCFFGNEEVQGVQHSGDNLTGEGSGDDESIILSLEKVAPEVQQIFFSVNIYTTGRSFANVANPYCRLFSSDGEEFCKYQLKEAGQEQALLMARMFREPGDRWGFQALGVPCKGKTYKDSMPAIVQYASTKPTDRKLMRQSSSLSAADFDIALAAAPAARRPNPFDSVRVVEESDSHDGGCPVVCSIQ